MLDTFPNAMLIRLYSRVLGLMAIAVVMTLFAAWYLPSALANSLFFPLVPQLQSLMMTATEIVLILSALIFAMETWRLWRWSQGKGPCCDRCGGLVQECIGSRRATVRCLHCRRRTYL